MLAERFSANVVGHVVRVELKNEMSVCGRAVMMDPTNMNLLLTNITSVELRSDPLKNPHLVIAPPHLLNLQQLYIRGSSIRYVDVDEIKLESVVQAA